MIESTEIIEILLVEDNAGDVQLTREAFEEAKVRNRLHVVSDGVEALQFLRQEGRFAGQPRPDLVLLDLNLPRKGGLEVLTEIKQDPELRQVPVVVLTTSQAEADITQSYNRYANAYISKPVDLDKFLEVVRSLEHFWLAVVRLPIGA
ncbi:response regulator [Meiothermus granaticius]|uniref:Response regulator rcp1 n=1 Tax=Meiothermus granaticius NBRC 107808 TaxID=1227551 RepID=A0A399F3R2_9DEIN|nr:response regulator [Meiothermus granaticius]MCL6526032.1 response regulator [Thermaceae bacterium]RIH91377.1 Response regulator rcp1 [Meiothermus granaticius NBRC 107808]GEM86918.1 two-component system response regulator [Meiothermus granaticius NBRC 107808]